MQIMQAVGWSITHQQITKWPKYPKTVVSSSVNERLYSTTVLWHTAPASATPHTQPFYGHLGLCLGIHGWSGTRKVKPGKTKLNLLEQETVSGSGISWAICKYTPWPRHIPCQHPTTVFYRLDALPAAELTVSKYWRHRHMAHTYCERKTASWKLKCRVHTLHY